MKWHENEDFWKKFSVVLFNKDRVSKAKIEVAGLLALTSIPPSSKILDLACGVGRHTVELSLRGFKTSGLDYSAHLLELAKNYAKKKNADVEWIKSDMRKLDYNDIFDMVLSLWTSFGYFDQQVDNYRVLENVYRSLKPGGVFVLELITTEIFERNCKPIKKIDFGKYTIIEESLYKKDSTKTEFYWTLLENGRIVAKESISHWLYSSEVLQKMLKNCGFKNITSYGDFNGANYDENSNTIILLSYK
ncbi:class I SAM-dependent methyltransferase [Rheinheimera fenheensis]|uniref:class I SAM-dependent methyltransferase n=1 Tax=Rheinheimera fenheensis TaxID=3152295 RepID=UPI00326060C9